MPSGLHTWQFWLPPTWRAYYVCKGHWAKFNQKEVARVGITWVRQVSSYMARYSWWLCLPASLALWNETMASSDWFFPALAGYSSDNSTTHAIATPFSHLHIKDFVCLQLGIQHYQGAVASVHYVLCAHTLIVLWLFYPTLLSVHAWVLQNKCAIELPHRLLGIITSALLTSLLATYHNHHTFQIISLADNGVVSM